MPRMWMDFMHHAVPYCASWLISRVLLRLSSGALVVHLGWFSACCSFLLPPQRLHTAQCRARLF